MLVSTLLLGLLFVLLQTLAWRTWHTALLGRPPSDATGRLALVGFYVLTGIHAAHVIGGLIAMTVLVARTRGVGAVKSAPVRYCAMYWHFLGVVWVRCSSPC